MKEKVKTKLDAQVLSKFCEKLHFHTTLLLQYINLMQYL